MNLSRRWRKVLSVDKAGPNPTRMPCFDAQFAHCEDSGALRPSVSVLQPRHRCRWLQLAAAGLFLMSCKTALPPLPPPEAPPAVPPEDRAPPPLQVPDEKAALKRRQAAAALTDRGRMLMAAGQVDPAMRLFEQALSLAPRYGPGYFYLADAWLLKNNWDQAREFHRQAVLYLPADTAWQRRVDTQRRRIDHAAERQIRQRSRP